MYKVEHFVTIRDGLNEKVGKEVNVARLRGRQKKEIVTGTIENTYPNVFTIKVEKGDNVSLCSYSYVDIITNAIKLNFVE